MKDYALTMETSALKEWRRHPGTADKRERYSRGVEREREGVEEREREKGYGRLVHGTLHRQTSLLCNN